MTLLTLARRFFGAPLFASLLVGCSHTASNPPLHVVQNPSQRIENAAKSLTSEILGDSALPVSGALQHLPRGAQALAQAAHAALGHAVEIAVDDGLEGLSDAAYEEVMRALQSMDAMTGSLIDMLSESPDAKLLGTVPEHAPGVPSLLPRE